ncbi:MAG: hypothetical protein Q8T08_21275, partial [Ignavibacteria bacterium]|nr:hypothetical protein [Ignavibacteria bacterium]
FVNYLQLYADLDVEICRVYIGDKAKGIPSGTLWFGSENVMISFFAAVADFGVTTERKERIIKSISKLRLLLTFSQSGEDPLGLEILQKISQGFPTRKINVGTATRKLMFSSFKEFFRSEGDQSLKDCWIAEAN